MRQDAAGFSQPGGAMMKGSGSRWQTSPRDSSVRQHGGGRQGTMLMRVTALSGQDGKHTAIPAKT